MARLRAAKKYRMFAVQIQFGIGAHVRCFNHPGTCAPGAYRPDVRSLRVGIESGPSHGGRVCRAV